MLHIYTGDGKGKTTSAVGLAVRCAGSGQKVAFFQFLKSDTSSERNSLIRIDNITVFDVERNIPFLFNAKMDVITELKEMYKEKIDEIFEKVKDFNMFVFDEAVSAIDSQLIDIDDIVRFKEYGEVIITGRGNIEDLEQYADYITEMKKIKHPYDKGIDARFGIEF